MVFEINKEVKPNLLKIEDMARETPGAGLIPSHSAVELQLWFEAEVLADVRLMFEQAAKAPEGLAELIQLAPSPVLKHLGLVT